eukprot:CAMPEP_0197391130 /NCGR_PEP_ID=MMETSP1165-20131217/2885_1 /TAXON_ID=284809 /ORGANISM="Chrysocystis fragilis, Strain CCMP3189" /LENGTH=193 /DNA_ID=CAMNT_0042916681 /DNA_START=1 /DNA_END=582 /DNA_ORIENTATION=+
MSGSSQALLGRVFNKPGIPEVQWFDGLAVADLETNKTLFNATIPHNVKAGFVGNASQNATCVSYFHAELDGQVITDSNKQYTSKDGLVVTAEKLPSHVRGSYREKPVYDDKLTVKTRDFTFTFANGKETNSNLYDSREEQMAYTHINVEFPKISLRKVHGPLFEIFYKDILPLSLQAKAWKSKGNAYASASTK